MSDARRDRAEQLVRNFMAKWHDTEFLIEGICALAQQEAADAVAESLAPTCTQTGKKAVGGVCHEHGGDGCLMASALLNERRRAVAYLRVLRDNHPHLRNAYEHAAINLEAALQTEWQPLHHEIKP